MYIDSHTPKGIYAQAQIHTHIEGVPEHSHTNTEAYTETFKHMDTCI